MSLPTATSSFLSPVSGIIPLRTRLPAKSRLEIEDPGKGYEAVIGSVGNKFEALLNGLSREKIKINFVAYRKNAGSPGAGT